jgi:hypothetical protein
MKKFYAEDGREVDILNVEGEISEGAQVTEAQYVDSDDDVSESVMEYLSDKYQEQVYEMFYDNVVGEAEYLSEGER